MLSHFLGIIAGHLACAISLRGKAQQKEVDEARLLFEVLEFYVIDDCVESVRETFAQATLNTNEIRDTLSKVNILTRCAEWVEKTEDAAHVLVAG